MKLNKIVILVISVFVLGACSNNIQEETNITENPIIDTKNKPMGKEVGISDSQNTINLINVSLTNFKKELLKDESIIIDLRTTKELKETGIISGASQIDFYASDFKNILNDLDKNKKYLIYCRSGGRSAETLSIMKDLGFKNVFELRGGMNGWLSAGETTIAFPEKANDDMMKDMSMTKVISLNAKNWEFDKKIIKAKLGDKLTIKVNNIDGLHGIAIPDMKIIGDNQIEVDTSKTGEFKFVCANYCGEGHANMTGTLIIE